MDLLVFLGIIIVSGIIIIAVPIIVITILSSPKEFFKGGGTREKPKYKYMRKQFFLTRAEHECYDALVAAVGNEYYIFAQVYLPTFLDNKVKTQNWRAARAHIDRKSVDFMLCDKVYISPKLAIELDDKSHERPDRQERDREVERILSNAGVPFLRLKNRGTFKTEEIAERIKQAISGVPVSLV